MSCGDLVTRIVECRARPFVLSRAALARHRTILSFPVSRDFLRRGNGLSGVRRLSRTAPAATAKESAGLLP